MRIPGLAQTRTAILFAVLVVANIVAIDNIVRKLMQRGDQPRMTGLFFSLGPPQGQGLRPAGDLAAKGVNGRHGLACESGWRSRTIAFMRSSSTCV